MFPINILGIFSSGGAVPITALPLFHHFFSTFLPARHMVDGLRVMLYYNGKFEAGLGIALMIIVAYFVVFSGICLVVAYRNHNKERSVISYLKTHSDKKSSLSLFPCKT